MGNFKRIKTESCLHVWVQRPARSWPIREGKVPGTYVSSEQTKPLLGSRFLSGISCPDSQLYHRAQANNRAAKKP